MTKITVGCAQLDIVFGDKTANLEKIREYTNAFKGDLLVFPELATSGYEFINRDEVMDLAFRSKSEEMDMLMDIAEKTDVTLIVGFPERSEDKVFNACVFIRKGQEPSIYRKIHLFDREKNLFDKGNSPPFVLDSSLGKIGMMICFDWIFPETARMLALQGAQIICHPSNLVLTYCQRAMFARSVENGVFTITCNRIGTEKRTDRALTFTGQSQILSNRGVMLAQASLDQEGLISAEIEPALSDNKMITQLNHILNDRRTELYTELL